MKRVYERETKNAQERAVTEKVLELDVVAGAQKPPADAILNQSLYYQANMQEFEPVASVALLRDEWLATPVKEGDIVHLYGAWEMKPYRGDEAQPAPEPSDDDDLWDGLDDHLFDAVLGSIPTMTLASFLPVDAPASQHLLVLHPDTIISASNLASVASCMRRPMLQERIKTASDTTFSAVFGNMVHGLLQACLVGSDGEKDGDADLAEAMATVETDPLPAPATWTRLGNFSRPFITAEIERQLVQNRAALSIVGAETERTRTSLAEVVPSLVSFGERYLAPKDGSEHAEDVEDRRAEHEVRICLTRILGTEDDVVSPLFGLKGRVDVCVEAHIYERGRINVAVLPLEIKTGRVLSSTEHAAQTSLYTLLLSDRYGVEIESGLLLYTQSSAMSRVHRALREVRSLLLARNEMATYKSRLPTIVVADDASDDEFGFDDAALAQLDDPSLLPPTIDSAYKCARCYARDACMLYRAAVEHVRDPDSAIAELYTQHTEHLSGTDRTFFQHWDALLSHEEQGLARFRNELWTLPAAERESVGRCVAGLVLEDASKCLFSAPDARMLSASWAVDDLVLLSTHTPHAAFVGRGRVAHVTQSRIALRMENAWRETLVQVKQQSGVRDFTFRLDQDELSTMLSVPRYNIACLFYPDAPPRVTRLAKRVVHLEAPQWAPLSAELQALVRQYTPTCNADQVAAIERALEAQDYALVLGMPGTGKSTTIAALIRILAAAGQTVLLCSYTHSAVDTVLTKLGDGLDVLRVGAPGRVHPCVRHYCLDERLGRTASVEALDTLAAEAQVVAATCLATNEAVFARRTFDVCIVDEASQITVPTCLGPLRYADRFVMIGDHHQLAPLVREEAAAAHGLQTSLFQRLCTAHPAAMVALAQQYRMNDAIMALSNALVYDGRLACGSEAIARSTLALDQRAYDGPAWLVRVLAPDVQVAFVDTDAIGAHESRTDGVMENAAEAMLLAQICTALGRGGLAASDIGVLTPYRHQARLLKTSCAAEVLTVDQSQGRDWPVVLVSLVRSNAQGSAGTLLRDVRRLNVLLTRAKRKLVLVGSARTLSGHDGDGQRPMPRLMRLLRDAEAIYAVPATQHATKTSPSKQRAVKTQRVARVAAEALYEHGLDGYL